MVKNRYIYSSIKKEKKRENRREENEKKKKEKGKKRINRIRSIYSVSATMRNVSIEIELRIVVSNSAMIYEAGANL